MKVSYELKNLMVLFVVLIDLLFLPRLTVPFSIPISLLFLIVWFFLEKGIKLSIVKYILLAMLSSIVLSSVLYGEDINRIDNLKRGLQLISLWFFYVFAINLKQFSTERVLVILLRLTFLHLILMSIIFYLDPTFYGRIINSIYPETRGNVEDLLMHLRFPYIFKDPNSASYFVTILLCGILVVDKSKLFRFLISIAAVWLILLTQSRGGLLSLLCIFVTYILFISELKLVSKLLLSVFISLSIFIVVIQTQDLYYIYESILERFNQEDSLGGGRGEKYKYFLSNFNVLPWGNGYNLVQDGHIFRPHSDLIRFNLSYGLLLLPLLLLPLLPKNTKELIFFYPLITAFLINTIFDDYRLIAVYLVVFFVARDIIKKKEICIEK
ncbi:hypothetical protein GCM10009347_25370 [Shewanella algicola]|uniref:O-antigen ligase family protein n=1 Tax=Shewanella algicola TaxID=640633 RepID=A0A9X2CAL2_9GAMM|nr:O-antigen ligase family protein [Shewanella algicola]MCL1106150.1 O-antigen ligase family protein [Shewanella algicola]GGP57855.1 hypothetical protein GCM10009347_25370 [Shewanella algicola]